MKLPMTKAHSIGNRDGANHCLETVGFRTNVDQDNLVESTLPNPLAQKAGIQAGDRMIMKGQPIISIVDIQWVLHYLPKVTNPSIISMELPMA